MSYQGYVTFTYTSKDSDNFKYDSSFPELLPEETVTIEVPCYDLNVHQYFAMFRKFLSALGFCERVFLDGAFRVAFSDINDSKIVDKLMEEYEIQDKQYYTTEDYEHLDREYKKLQKEVLDLKAKLSRCENPDVPDYTEEEIEAMDAEAQQENKQELLKKLQNANVVCFDCGSKYGEYHDGVSSVWQGTCNVCGEVKRITESRDFKYLQKGIKDISK